MSPDIGYILFLGNIDPPRNTPPDQARRWSEIVEAIQSACNGHALGILFDGTGTHDPSDTGPSLGQLNAYVGRVLGSRLVVTNLDQIRKGQLPALIIAGDNNIPILGLTSDLSNALPNGCKRFSKVMSVVRFDRKQERLARSLMAPIFTRAGEQPHL